MVKSPARRWGGGPGTGDDGVTEETPGGGTKPPSPKPKPKRFYGTCKMDAARMTRDAGNIADEVLQHLTSLLGAEVSVSLEIHANIPTGVPDDIVRTVMENSRTLKFDEYDFEEE